MLAYLTGVNGKLSLLFLHFLIAQDEQNQEFCNSDNLLLPCSHCNTARLHVDPSTLDLNSAIGYITSLLLFCKTTEPNTNYLLSI